MNIEKYDVSRFKSPFEKRIAIEYNALLDLKDKSSKFDFEVIGTTGKVPTEYRIVYFLKSIVDIDDQLNPILGYKHVVTIKLSPKYPLERPVVNAETPIWHPNVRWDGRFKGSFSLDIGSISAWHDLTMLIIHIASLLQWKNYHAELTAPYPEDIKVAKWVRNYAEPNQIVDKYKNIYIDDSNFIDLKESYSSKYDGKEVNIIIRILPQADEVEVSLPLTITSKELIEQLLNSDLGIRRKDNDNEIIYQLIPKVSSIPLNKNDTLFEANVKEGDVILMIPPLFAHKEEDEKLTLSVVILPMNHGYDVELPRTSNGKIIKETLIRKFDKLKGDVETLKLIIGKNGEEILNNQNLIDYGLENGDNLILSLTENRNEESEIVELKNFKENLIGQLGLSPDALNTEIHEEVDKLLIQVKKKNELKFLIDKWIQELSRSEINKVTQELLKYCRKNKLKEYIPPVLQQSTRWNTIHKRSIEGTLSNEEFILQLNKINLAVINIIMELEDL